MHTDGEFPPVLMWADLVGLGIDAIGSYPIELRVTDPHGLWDTDPAVIIVVDTTPPECEAELERVQVSATQGEFRVSYSCTDLADPDPEITADVNGVPVFDGQMLDLIKYYDGQVVYEFLGGWIIKAAEFLLTVHAVDASGNAVTVGAVPQFDATAPGTPPDDPPPPDDDPPPPDEDPPPPDEDPPVAAPDDCSVELIKLFGYWNQATFRVAVSCSIEVASMALDINGYGIVNGQSVELKKTWGTERAYDMFGTLRIEAPDFTLTLVTNDPDGTWTAQPEF